MRCLLPGLAVLALAACAAPSPAARQRAAAPPPPGPRGVVVAFPPRDSSFYPLRCLPNGEEIDCKRATN